MKSRWLGLVVGILFLLTLTALSVSANSIQPTQSQVPSSLRRCENNYDDDELQEIRDNGDDAYEPDDCPMLAHVLTGPMLLNFCLPGDEDWIKFNAQPKLLYQIRAAAPWNYPTEPRIELYVDGMLVAANDHYFNNEAEVWWWNSATARVVYLRIFEFAGRHDCGNSAYTLTLNSFNDNPYPKTSVPPIIPMSTTTITATATVTMTNTVPLTATATITAAVPVSPTLSP
jgi:hypothetical protein